MFKSISENKFKTVGIVALVTLFVMAVVYYIAYYTGYGSIAIPIALVVAFFASFIAYYNSDKMVLSISGARPADPETDRVVQNAMEEICIASGLPMPKVYVINDPSPNAFATGRNPQHAAVCVTTGLLQKMDYYELQGVLAHEMAHIGNYDILLSTVVTVMVGFVVILSDFWTRSFFWGGGRRRSSNKNNEGGAGAILMIIGLVFLILAPIFGQLMKMALSRNREFLADATAAKFTRNPEGLASALEKLAGDTRPVARATNATSSLYIVNPLKGEKMRSLLSTHPPIEKRIEALRNMR